MAAEVAVEVDGMDSLIQRMVKAQKGLTIAERKGVEKAALHVLAEAKKSFTGGSPGKSHPTKIVNRTGTMRNALGASKGESTSDGWKARVGYREGLVSKQVRLHESLQDVVTITPRLKEWLAIPIADNLTPGGDVRFKSPRQVQGGHWQPDSTGKGLVFIGPAGELLFAGKRSVKVRPRRPLINAFKKSRKEQVNIINAEIGKFATKLKSGVI